MYLEVIAILRCNKHDDLIHARVSKLVFHQSKCICVIKRILSTTAMYTSSSSFMCVVFACSMSLRCMLNFKRLACGSEDITQLLNTILSWLCFYVFLVIPYACWIEMSKYSFCLHFALLPVFGFLQMLYKIYFYPVCLGDLLLPFSAVS